jgi:hypothetical protein
MARVPCALAMPLPQLQLDVYGEIADAIFQARLHGMEALAANPTAKPCLSRR